MTALVIGGTGGIGSAVVERLALDDDVVFTYLKAEQRATALSLACADQGRRATAEALDVRDEARLGDVVRRSGADGGLRAVVLTMGSGVPRVQLSDFRRRHWQWTIETNARATAEVFKAVLPLLAEAGGAMVALTSIGSTLVLPNYALVGPAKAATEATVRYAAFEAGPFGVRVNGVAAGLVRTPAVSAYPDHASRLADTARQTPLGRLVEPGEVAEAVSWLVSPASFMVTGQVLLVDGGWGLRCGIE